MRRFADGFTGPVGQTPFDPTRRNHSLSGFSLSGFGGG